MQAVGLDLERNIGCVMWVECNLESSRMCVTIYSVMVVGQQNEFLRLSGLVEWCTRYFE